MAKVVVTGKIPAGGLARLKAEHDVTAWESDDAISRADLLAMVAGADAIVSLLTEKISTIRRCRNTTGLPQALRIQTHLPEF